MFASGAVIGLSVGGTIIQHFGWQATFLTIIPIAISLLIVIWRCINVNQNDLRQQQPFHLQQRVSRIRLGNRYTLGIIFHDAK
jgi:predicted MFS family arabinose efflux permease